MARPHRVTVDVAGSAGNPGLFVWRCSCGAGTSGVAYGGVWTWDDAAAEGRAHVDQEDEQARRAEGSYR